MPPHKDNAVAGRRPTAVTAACFIVAALAVVSALNSYAVSARHAAAFPDTYGIESGEIRFAGVRDRVPPLAELGYVTDIEPSHAAYSNLFLAAQYVLGPRQLAPLSKTYTPEWAVGNFSRPVDYSAIGARYGYEIVSDFGNGVVLFRRKPSQ